MKQFQFEYDDIAGLQKNLEQIKAFCKEKNTSALLFQIYAETVNETKINEVTNTIEAEIPYANYMGCSSNGGIFQGNLTKSEIVVVATVFEKASSRLDIMQYNLTESSARTVARALIQVVDKNPWIKGVCMFLTIRGMSMTSFCEELSFVKKRVHIFGGGAFNPNLNDDLAYVFSKSGGLSNTAVVFALMGGEDFYIETTYITGWIPLGKEFRVTKANGCILQELDYKPAYEVYRRYLDIPNDERFFNNVLEFPLFCQLNGIDILKAPISCQSDGSLVMTSDIEKSTVVRMAYGDPHTILEHVHSDCIKISKFCPEAIQVFSCAARRTFWGSSNLSKELEPFQAIAPTSGFCTSGEFLRTASQVNQHNVTLVVVSMREGAPKESLKKFNKLSILKGKTSIIGRMAKFISTATQELETANHNVTRILKTDSLTGISDREEIHKILKEEIEKKGEFRQSLSVIRFDVDNFSPINDTYGLHVGDEVLRRLSNAIQKIIEEYAPMAKAGRCGDDEFLMVLPFANEIKGLSLAENIRSTISRVNMDTVNTVTISVGVTEVRNGESADSVCARVNGAMNNAKRKGKNRVEMV